MRLNEESQMGDQIELPHQKSFEYIRITGKLNSGLFFPKKI